MTDQSWEDPGAFEICPGIFRVPLPLPKDILRKVLHDNAAKLYHVAV